MSDRESIDGLVEAAAAVWRTEPGNARDLVHRVLGDPQATRDQRSRARLVAADAYMQLQQVDESIQVLLDGWDERSAFVVQFHRRLGVASSALGHLDAALEALDAALDVPGGDPVERFRVRLDRAGALRRHRRRLEAAEAYDQLLSEPAPTERLRHTLLLNAASCLHQVGRAPEALGLLREAETLETGAGAGLEAWRHTIAAWAHLALNELEHARDVAELALTCALGDPSAEPSAIRVLALAEARASGAGYQRAVERLEALVQRYEAGPRSDLITVLQELANVHSHHGHLERAHPLLERVVIEQQALMASAHERRRVAERARIWRLRQKIEAGELRIRNQELAQSAARLGKENEARERELLQLAHDLRNPLTVVIAATDLVGEERPDRPELVQSIQTQARRMWQLLDDVLERRGERSMVLEAFDPGALVATVVDGYRARAGAKGVTIGSEVLVHERVISDPSWTGRILDNLVANAVKFSSGGHVDVLLEPVLDTVGVALRLEVSDRGPGFAADELVRVFDEGYVGHAPATGQEPSSGYGLWVVRCLVEAMGGTVAAGNREDALGGAWVRVIWPIQVPSEAA